ncbi:hypothetical protein EVAR_5037_1 [Eumeta japonica]|uniref:Uncharacterized protein n=1 Tax=Eumeta variegata TaxID=151549 RepID=A0A4C1STY6_EUMVA|nr:hypothetical protein EVAR_5037_1 [Eumeta japonica]
MTSQMAQALTGHGRFTQYLFSFKLRDPLHCPSDPAKIQDVLHVLEECDMFLREREAEIKVQITRRQFSEIIEDKARTHASLAVRVFYARESTELGASHT